MFTSLPFRRLLAGTTALSMLLPAISASAQDDTSTPPTRAGQIAQISGGVSFEGSGSGGWAAAQLNYPVSGDDSDAHVRVREDRRLGLDQAVRRQPAAAPAHAHAAARRVKSHPDLSGRLD